MHQEVSVTLIEKLEHGGRLVLWLSLASAVMLAPIMYIRQRGVESQLAETARQEELAKAKEAEKAAQRSDRLSFASMGPVIRALNASTAVGELWFSNVSPRSGVVCVAGIATNPSSGEKTESLATCKQVPAYATNVEMQVMFAGGVIAPLCKGVTCSFTLREVPDSAAPALAASP